MATSHLNSTWLSCVKMHERVESISPRPKRPKIITIKLLRNLDLGISTTSSRMPRCKPKQWSYSRLTKIVSEIWSTFQPHSITMQNSSSPTALCTQRNGFKILSKTSSTWQHPRWTDITFIYLFTYTFASQVVSNRRICIAEAGFQLLYYSIHSFARTTQIGTSLIPQYEMVFIAFYFVANLHFQCVLWRRR